MNKDIVSWQYLPGGEPVKQHSYRIRTGFYEKYLSGKYILDIGGGKGPAIVCNAKIIDLDFPGYDGVNLPFSDESQDAVFSSHCLEHVADPIVTLQEWFRVLRKGGYLIITVPHQHLYERKSLLPSRWNQEHLRFYTPAKLLLDIETALEINTYRVRELQDNDDGFDYSVKNNQHAVGSYEIEVVVEKIDTKPYLDFTYQRLADELKSRVSLDEPIVIYGAGIVGDEVYYSLRLHGVKSELVFADRNSSTLIDDFNKDKKIVSIQECFDLGYRHFVLASYTYQAEMDVCVKTLAEERSQAINIYYVD